MKKTYSKPDIVFENFSLSTSVAAACKIMSPDPDLQPEGAGGVRVEAGWFVVFQNTTQGCSYIQDDGYLNGFCYHNPADFNDVFYS